MVSPPFKRGIFMIALYIVLAALALLIAVLVIRTFTFTAKARKLAPEKENVTPEKALEYAERLSRMIQCRTVSVKDSYDDTEFGKLRKVLEELFPLVTEKTEKMTFGDDCWIYKLKGKDETRNMMVMSHHDVVAEGDKALWKHEPFGGEIIDGDIWGRGTVDTKTPLFAEFSALEELLAEGYVPPCNLYIGSSHNEELGGDGIPLALKYFEEQGITFELILDEGGAIIDAPMAGINCRCAMLAVHEKGRYTLECRASEGDSHTGLTANTETPVVRMSRFITEMNTKNVFIRRIYPEVKAMLEALAPYASFPMRLIFSNLWLFAPVLKVVIPKLNAQAGSMVGTACSFSSIKGGKFNEDNNKECFASCFMRCVDIEDQKQDIEAMKKVAAKYGVEIKEAESGNEYHQPADFTRPQFDYVKQCIGEIFPQVGAVPFILPAGTDARHFSDICRCVVRFAPIDINNQQYASVHSPNENISVKAVGNAVAFYKHFMKNYK